MKTSKGFANILTITIIIILAGTTLYFGMKSRKVADNSINTSNSTQSTSKTEDNRSVYSNQAYGYSLKISDGYTYKESTDTSGGLFVTNLKDQGALTVNIFAPSDGGSLPNSTTQIGGQTANIYTFTDEHGLSRKSYQITNDGLIYEITFAPLNDPRLEAMAQSFRFTK